MASVLDGMNFDNLFIINYTSLQNILTQVVAAVRENSAEILALQDSFAGIQDEHSSKKQLDKLTTQDIKQELIHMREQLKTLVTGSDVNELKFSMEQKHKTIEELLGKTREDVNTATEEINEMRGEIIKNEGNIGGCRRDIDKLRQEYNTSSSGTDYKLENLDNKFSNFVNQSTALVTKEELKGKVKDEVQSFRREIEEIHKATAEVHGELQKKLTEVLEGDFEEMKQAVPDLRETVSELMKNTTNASADVKSIKVFLEHQAKIVKELQDSIDSKADKHSLEDVAKSKMESNHQALRSSLSQDQLIKSEPAESESSQQQQQQQQQQQTQQTQQQQPPTPQQSQPQQQSQPTQQQQQHQPGQLTNPKINTNLAPLAFGKSSPTKDSYTGGNPPEFTAPVFYSSIFVVDNEQAKPTGSEEGQYMSIVADTVDTPAPELISKELKETQKQCVDLRKDLSDLASLVEVLTSELKNMKQKDTTSEVWLALDQHTTQLSHLLHTKADLSNVDHALSYREYPKPQQAVAGGTGASQDEMDNLRQAVNSKAGRDELRKLRKALQKELDKAVRESLALGMADPAVEGSAALATRSHYRCLACDRLIWKVNITKSGQAEKPSDSKFLPNPNYDIAPNIAWRRSQVKELVSNKHHAATVNSLVNTIGGTLSPSHSHSHSPHKSQKRAVTPTTPLPPISPTLSRSSPTRESLEKLGGGGEGEGM